MRVSSVPIVGNISRCSSMTCEMCWVVQALISLFFSVFYLTSFFISDNVFFFSFCVEFAADCAYFFLLLEIVLYYFFRFEL